MRARLKSERGAELIEFALIFPILLLVVVGIVDFGFLFQRFEVLTNAAREGARLGVLPNYSVADVQSRVCGFLAAGGVPTTGNCAATGANPTVTMTQVPVNVPGQPTPIQTQMVTVSYTHNYMFIGPIMNLTGGTWANTQTLTATAVMRIEDQ